MKSETSFQFFIYYILPPLILVFGMFGNTIGMIVLKNKRLISMTTRKMYIYLFFFDTIYLFHLMINYLEISYSIDITFTSNLACKLHIYLNYSLATISPMILVYISIERFIQIKYPAKRYFLRQNKIQIAYLITITCYNLLFYLPFPILIENIIIKDDEHHILMCSFRETLIDDILSYMDLINRVVLPFSLMIICSLMLMYSIFKSRTRVLNNYTSNENKTFRKDLKLSVTSVLLNLIYIVLCSPISIHDFVDFSDFNFTLALYVFYFSYAVNFYIVLMCNSLVRREILILFKIRSAYEQNYVVRYIQIDCSQSTRQSNQLVEMTRNDDEKALSNIFDHTIDDDNDGNESREINSNLATSSTVAVN